MKEEDYLADTDEVYDIFYKMSEKLHIAKELRDKHNEEYAVWREKRDILKEKYERENDQIKRDKIEEDLTEAIKNVLQHHKLADEYHKEMVKWIKKKVELANTCYAEWLSNLPENVKINIMKHIGCDKITKFEELTDIQKKKIRQLWRWYQRLKKLEII